MQQTNTSLPANLRRLELVTQSTPQAASRKPQAASRKPQAGELQVLTVLFAKAALPSHRHSGKPARFEFTRNVRLQADTGFGHVFCRTTVSQCEIKKGNTGFLAEEGMRLSKLRTVQSA